MFKSYGAFRELLNRRRDLFCWLIMLIILIWYCRVFAAHDVYIAARFFDAEAREFTYHNHPLAVFFHEMSSVVTAAAGGFLLYWAAVYYLRRKTERAPCRAYLLSVRPKAAAYVALVWLIGPGLIVNAAFKDHWGRARPHQISIFGGEKRFTPAFFMTDQCERNCSFSSGDPAAGFALAAFAAMDRRRRRFWFALSLAAGAAFGATRVIQGKHFFTDVLTTMFVVYSVIYWLRELPFFRDVIVSPLNEECAAAASKVIK